MAISVYKSTYDKQGYVVIPDLFSQTEVDALKNLASAMVGSEKVSVVNERDDSSVRSIYGCHLVSDEIVLLSRSARILNCVKEILGGDVYIYQSKINIKDSFSGGGWPWHQDYIFWRNGDSMPGPSVLTVMVMLDEANEFNGPMYVIPNSQSEGTIESATGARADWESDVSENLSYVVPKEIVSDLVCRYGLVSLKGRQGTTVIFDSNLVHASPSNISPFSRRSIFLTYNRVDNAPKAPARPDFLATRRVEVLNALNDH